MKLWSIILCCVTYYFHRTTAITFNHHGLSITYEDSVLKNITGTPDTLNVNLSEFRINKIDDYALDALKDIESLDLSGNLLHHFPRMAVECKNLRVLSLANNPHFQIDVEGSIFRPFSNLAVLNLTNTGITEIRGQMFVGIPKTANVIIEANWIPGIQGPINDDKKLDVLPTKPQMGESRRVRSDDIPSWMTSCQNDDGILEFVDRTPENGSLCEYKDGEHSMRYPNANDNLKLLGFDLVGFKRGWCRKIRSFRTVDARVNSLSHIGSEFTDSLPLSITGIDLRMNIISTIEDGVFERFKSLELLYLDNNKLKNSAFIKTLSGTLLDLGLRYNKIDRIESGTFENLKGLIELDLAKNEIREIPRYLFINLERLRYLYLHSNNIEIIRNDTFPKRIKHLGFDDNKIHSIESGSFKDVTIDSLRLPLNNITEEIFSNNVFEGASFKFVNLDANSITKIPTGAFKKNVKISGELILASNPLEIIEKGAFEGLHDLCRLDLEDTKVTELKNGTFFGLSRQCKINISRTPLRLIQADAFDN